MPVDKVCPECGISMEGVDPEGHALTHWPAFLDPAHSSPLARERQEALLKGGVTQAAFDKEHPGEG